MNSPNTFLIILACLAALGLIFYANHSFYQEYLATLKSAAPLQIAKPEEHSWIEINFGDHKRTFEGVADDYGYNLAAVLKSVAKYGNIPISIKNNRLETLANIKNENGSWKIYRNGEPINRPLNSIKVLKGNRYILRLEK